MKLVVALSLCLVSVFNLMGKGTGLLLPVPQLYRTPEYGWTGGVALFYLQKADSLKGRLRPSYYETGAYLSEFGFYGARVSWQSFGRKNNYFSKGEAIIGKNQLNYYGQARAQIYTLSGTLPVATKIAGQRRWKCGKHLFAGPRLVAEKWRQIGDLLPKMATGRAGFNVVGLGGGLFYDSRNNPICPSSGWVGEWQS
jgi:hypothetical protein